MKKEIIDENALDEKYVREENIRIRPIHSIIIIMQNKKEIVNCINEH